MKTRYIIALSILAAVVSCNKTEQLEPQASGDLVTITAILPDAADVKGASMKTSLSWTWNEGDKITVIGETTETFKIKVPYGWDGIIINLPSPSSIPAWMPARATGTARYRRATTTCRTSSTRRP